MPPTCLSGGSIGKTHRSAWSYCTPSLTWQDTYDDHGSEVWPEVEWEEWQSEGQRLLPLVRHELGPGVEIQITF